jgi:hypothetical protein
MDKPGGKVTKKEQLLEAKKKVDLIRSNISVSYRLPSGYAAQVEGAV